MANLNLSFELEFIEGSFPEKEFLEIAPEAKVQITTSGSTELVSIELDTKDEDPMQLAFTIGKWLGVKLTSKIFKS